MDQEKSNMQEIAEHVIVIERLKSELERERKQKEDQMINLDINLDDIKVNVDEFNCMKDMIRNNLEVNRLNVTFEVPK